MIKSVIEQINTILTANGFKKSSFPIDLETPSSITDNSYSIEHKTKETNDYINSAYRIVHIDALRIQIAKKLSGGNKNEAYENFLQDIESLIVDLEDTQNWDVGLSTINYIKFISESTNLNPQNYIVIANIEIEVNHTI